MDNAAFEAFTAALTRSLEARSNVLALVLLGSTADPQFRDEWSDHDFWVVTRPGEQDVLLADLSWLPSSEDVLIQAKHGARHRAVLYSDGQLVELAVFDVDEVERALATSYRIVFDRGEVTGAVAVAHANAQPPEWNEDRAVFLFSNFLIVLQTAVARWRRGEYLSARRYVSHLAVDNLIRLVLGLTGQARAPAADPLDPRRRVERLLPELAAAVSNVEQRPVPEAVVLLLDIAVQTIAPLWPAYPKHEADAVLRLLLAAVR